MSKCLIVAESNEGVRSNLPPVICSNIRPKVEAAQVPIDALKLKHKEIIDPHKQLVYYDTEPTLGPISKHQLILSWEPDYLHFELFEEPVEVKLRVMNRSAQPIQMQCCGLWGEMSRLGASWRSYPHTRFWAPSGLAVNMFVRATPKALSPIPSTRSSLQIAASHLRDHVTGYFMVPIQAYFLKYVQPVAEEE